MPSLVTRMIFIFILMFVLNTVRRYLAHKSVQRKVELPSKIQRIGLKVQLFLPFITAPLAIMGFVLQDIGFAIASLVLTLAFVVITFFTYRKFKKIYEENDEYFLLNGQYFIHVVRYENIIDWVPLDKQIGVLDKTKEEDVYYCVNLNYSNPKILLEKLAEMTFSGKFNASDDKNHEQELINFLQKHGYGNILEEFSKE